MCVCVRERERERERGRGRERDTHTHRHMHISESAVEVMPAEATCLPPKECQSALHVTWKQDKLLCLLN